MSLSPVLPWWILLILFLAASGLFVWWWRQSERRLATVRAQATPGLAGALENARRKSRLSWIRRVGIVLLVFLAMLRPGFGSVDASTASGNLDVVVMVDTTSSSLALDYGSNQTRFSGMKADLQALVEKLPGARWSLISFDRSGVIRLPLTTDSTAFGTAVDILTTEVTFHSKGSSITEPREQLLSVLNSSKKVHPERTRVVFYLGDGEQTAASSPEPFSVPSGLVSGGAVLGYGTTAGAKMLENRGYGAQPGPGFVTDSQGKDGISKLDEKSLGEIAKQLNVGYIHREAGANINQVSGTVTAGALSGTGGSPSKAAFEIYWLLALLLIPLLIWEMIDLVKDSRKLHLIPNSVIKAADRAVDTRGSTSNRSRVVRSTKGGKL